MMSKNNILIYLFRHDLRISDNPILHHLASASDHGFTHILPLLVIAPQHLEVSGFLKDGKTSPYPPAKNQLSGLWKCGPHRAKFIGETILDLRNSMREAGRPLTIKVGTPCKVVDDIQQNLKQHGQKVGAIWAIDEEGTEEKDEEKEVAAVCSKNDIGFKLWTDTKYYIDE